MNERLYNVKDLPVKLFINCKNSKRKAPPSVKFPKRNIGSGAGADTKDLLRVKISTCMRQQRKPYQERRSILQGKRTLKASLAWSMSSLDSFQLPLITLH